MSERSSVTIAPILVWERKRGKEQAEATFEEWDLAWDSGEPVNLYERENGRIDAVSGGTAGEAAETNGGGGTGGAIAGTHKGRTNGEGARITIADGRLAAPVIRVVSSGFGGGSTVTGSVNGLRCAA